MPADSENAKPIDDEFWYAYSRKQVLDAILKRNEAAARLQTLTIWLWGIYTASATVGINLSRTAYPLPIILLIALPSPILIAAYWVTVWSQMPILTGFHPALPKSIRENYASELKNKDRKITISLIFSLLTAVLVSVALIAASLSKQTDAPNFTAHLRAQEGKNIMTISGHMQTERVIIKILPAKLSDTPSKADEFPYTLSASGKLQTPPIELKAEDTEYYVTVEWKEKDLIRSLKRAIATPKTEKDKQSANKVYLAVN